MPYVIIEGSDGTGKSTLAEAVRQLAEDSGEWSRVTLQHYGVPTIDPTSPLRIGEQFMNQLIEPDPVQNFNMLSDFLIWDRSHWGEPVYAPIFRPKLCVDPMFGTLMHKDFYHVETWAQFIGACNVYCTLDTDEIVKRIGARDEDDITDSDPEKRRAQIDRIKGRYENLLAYIGNPARRNPTFYASVEMKQPEDTDTVAKVVYDSAVDLAAARLREITGFGGQSVVSGHLDMIVDMCRPKFIVPESVSEAF